LGGKDNYAVDRGTLTAVETVMPSARHIAIENRKWLIRTVRFLAKHAEITQFLDCGSGLRPPRRTSTRSFSATTRTRQ
jgi:hypothetical protein